MNRAMLVLLATAAVSACQPIGGQKAALPSGYLQRASVDPPSAFRSIDAEFEDGHPVAAVQHSTRESLGPALESKGSGPDLRLWSDEVGQWDRHLYQLAQVATEAQAASPDKAAGAAQGQPEGAGAQKGGDLGAIGAKLADPTSNVWALFTEVDWNFYQGKATTSYRDGQTILFQPVLPVPLTEDFKLLTRPVVPFETTPIPDGLDIEPTAVPGQATTSGGVAGLTFDRKTGLADIQLPLLVSPVKGPKLGDGELGFGLGPTFVFPTATTDVLGNDRWQAGPAGVVTWKNKKITAGLFPQYWWNVDGKTPVTNHGALLYFFFYNLPDAWSIGTNPTATFNNEGSSGNKWSVPVGLTVAKTTVLGKLPVKIQFGGEYFVVNHDDYGPRFQFKLNIIPVIPALIDQPIFGGIR